MWRRVLILAVVAALALVVFRLIDPVNGRSPLSAPPTGTPGTASIVAASASPIHRPAPSPPLSSPAVAPVTAPVTFDSISFINAEVGWVAGGAGRATTALLVSRTADGGRTWSAGVPVAGATRPPDPSEVAVRFADTVHGWVSALGLWATSDGGATWRSTGITGWVGPVVVAGGSAWALQYPCGPAEQCTPTLITSTLPSQSWAPTAHPPPLPAGPASLVRANAGVAFITGSGTAAPASDSGDAGSPSPGAGAVLVKTTDGGATWVPSPSPCPATLGDATPATLDGTTVWMVCADVSHDEDQDKAIYVSRDGGTTWALQSSTGGDAPPVAGTLTSAGAVLGFTLSAPSTGFLVSSGYGLLRSTDGGATWALTSVSAKAIPTGNDVLMATFSGGSDGWAATCCGGGVPFGSPGLYATTDGGATWSPIAASP